MIAEWEFHWNEWKKALAEKADPSSNAPYLKGLVDLTIDYERKRAWLGLAKMALAMRNGKAALTVALSDMLPHPYANEVSETLLALAFVEESGGTVTNDMFNKAFYLPCEGE
ncbi:hypothetical protein [Paenibacillus polymyxa]|uniref:hypothetical protein n=1 Tax=Paenibacillus polymyxa TaxID=1406 RepID=UPI002ED519AE|nr:hypothetical protein [Paenibacillus polymyxa]